jgi:hypothetical protein
MSTPSSSGAALPASRHFDNHIPIRLRADWGKQRWAGGWGNAQSAAATLGCDGVKGRYKGKWRAATHSDDHYEFAIVL